MRSVGSRSEPVSSLHGGALLGIVYRTCRRFGAPATPLSGHRSSSHSSFNTMDDGQKSSAEALPHNFQLFSWETFKPVGGLLPQPEWTAWDQTVEYCAFAYQHYIVISSLRPQFRYLGDVAIPFATGAIWHRRQLFVATPTTIECVFVDAGIAPIDIETNRRKEEMKLREAQARAAAEHGELALLTVDSQQPVSLEKIALRPPMLQVVRLASFQQTPSIPPFLTLPKQSKADNYTSTLREMEERKFNEVAVGGGGVAVTATRFPAEQKRPVGPLVVAGVRDGALWLIDRYMCAHAISLSHPGIRCRCLAAHGDAVSAVKWASRLGREHHDDLAQFMLGMGYATEALHLPGISKRLEFDLALQSSDLKRALQCLLTMSNSRDIGHAALGLDLNDIMNLSSKKENVVDAVQGVAKFAKEFLDLIDAADATAQAHIAREALKRLAAAGSVKGALRGHELRGLALRLGNHGELTRLSNLVSSLISIGSGREAAFAAALLGDNALMEKAWQDTGMLAEAVLHAHAHGRHSLRSLVQEWNKTLQKEMEHSLPTKMDAAAAFLASLEESKITSLQDSAKKPPIEILPPGMASLHGPIPGRSGAKKQPVLALQSSQQQLLLEGPTEAPSASSEAGAPPSAAVEADAPKTSESESESVAHDSSAVDSAPTSEQEQPAESTNSNSESSDPINASEVDDDKTVEINEEQKTSLTEIQGSVAPESIDSPVATNAGAQESNDKGKGVHAHAETSMIDFS
ncbi:Transducin/WD40 repeat-like superfamily protein [Perilla frutescens var. hirtella]|uniref:Transducin/WD40 repeat-like superfamily protein n=1 Tax=Perilla frutescens var. hirtella TaxID=608512 RepID=A0AAD4J3E4_PERFH|nr:Transducin/WD40 repeat-like superfamily protein [Perilla frutescens var. hirtella]